MKVSLRQQCRVAKGQRAHSRAIQIQHKTEPRIMVEGMGKMELGMLRVEPIRT